MKKNHRSRLHEARDGRRVAGGRLTVVIAVDEGEGPAYARRAEPLDGFGALLGHENRGVRAPRNRKGRGEFRAPLGVRKERLDHMKGG